MLQPLVGQLSSVCVHESSRHSGNSRFVLGSGRTAVPVSVRIDAVSVSRRIPSCRRVPPKPSSSSSVFCWSSVGSQSKRLACGWGCRSTCSSEALSPRAAVVHPGQSGGSVQFRSAPLTPGTRPVLRPRVPSVPLRSLESQVVRWHRVATRSIRVFCNCFVFFERAHGAPSTAAPLPLRGVSVPASLLRRSADARRGLRAMSGDDCEGAARVLCRQRSAACLKRTAARASRDARRRHGASFRVCRFVHSDVRLRARAETRTHTYTHIHTYIYARA